MSRQVDPLSSRARANPLPGLEFAFQLLPAVADVQHAPSLAALIALGFFFGFVPLFDLIHGDCKVYPERALDRPFLCGHATRSRACCTSSPSWP
jgi:hypothetical protein